MYEFATDSSVDVEGIRARLQEMDDDQLRKHGRAARYKCSANATRGNPPREVFVVHLRESIEEWKRRHPKA